MLNFLKKAFKNPDDEKFEKVLEEINKNIDLGPAGVVDGKNLYDEVIKKQKNVYEYWKVEYDKICAELKTCPLDSGKEVVLLREILGLMVIQAVPYRLAYIYFDNPELFNELINHFYSDYPEVGPGGLSREDNVTIDSSVNNTLLRSMLYLRDLYGFTDNEIIHQLTDKVRVYAEWKIEKYVSVRNGEEFEYTEVLDLLDTELKDLLKTISEGTIRMI